MDSNRGVPDGTEDEATTTTTPKSTATTTSSEPSQAAATRLLAWKPNDSLLLSLTTMGISPVAAKKALYYTKNTSTEAAIEWIFENQEADLDTPLEIELQRSSLESGLGLASVSGTAAALADDDQDDDLYKMVFVVNAELTMGTGKVASQVAHAALGIHRILLQHQAKYGESLLNWTEYGETKIVLRGESTEHLIELENRAIEEKLPCYLVHDAGKTQVRSGSTTVLAIFGSNNKVDKVTGNLKLY